MTSANARGNFAIGFWASPFKIYLSISFTVTLLLRKNDFINIKAMTCKQYDHQIACMQ
jgi:hypothetical protein